jgi:hypothetical protein
MTSIVKLHVVLAMVTPHGQSTINIEQDKIKWIIVTKILI